MGKSDESYTWKPNTIKGADTLCDEKDDCGSLKSQYNVSNKLLSWSKSQPTVRTTMFNFRFVQFHFTSGPFPVHRSKFEILAVHHTPTPTEKFLTWSHSQRTSPHVPVTTTNHQTFDANGQKLRILLSDVSDQTTTNLMTVLLLTSTLTKCTNTKNKRTL